MISSTVNTLPNGLRIVTIRLPHLHSAELALYIKVGGRNDPPDKSGLSHFLEHMLFRGTRDYPTSTEIETAFEAVGGAVNASTDEESTCFFSRIHPDHIGKGVEILASMILRPLLTDIDIEKRIIAEEALDDLSDKGEEINPHNLACRLLWPDHQLGMPTIGTLDSIASFDLDDLRQHLEAFYLPHNAVLVAAGNFRPEFLHAAAADCFAPWSGGPPPVSRSPVERQQTPRSIFVSDADSQAHLQIAFRSPARTDSRIMALRLLRRLLCGSGSARLHLTLRERLGIVYSVDANISAYEETGYFSIELSTAPENLLTAVAEVLAEVERLTGTPVPAEELDRTRTSYCYELEFSRDSCFDMQIRYGWGELMGTVRHIEDDARKAAALTPDDLRRVAAAVFRPEHLNLVVVGAWQEKDRRAILTEIDRYAERNSSCCG